MGKGMNEWRTDFELLREFVRHSRQPAFADVVRRHLDLVYATALRKVEDPGAAEEVAQNVFAALARKAWQFGPDDSLPAWLYRTALLESREWLRGELRRRRREQTAVELGTTMKTPDEQTALRALVPLLDEALLSLREKDRAALLLRFYESRSLRDVGASLGVGEDAAQKRVAGALEQVTRFFQRRGFKAATVAVATAALQQTATSAPAMVMTSMVQAAAQFASPAATGLAALLSRVAGLGKIQTAALCTLILVVPAAWQLREVQSEKREARLLQDDVAAIGFQQETAMADAARLRGESERLKQEVADAAQRHDRSETARGRLVQLRGRLHGLLTASDSQWPADLPLVRTPRWALTNLSVFGAFDSSGKLATWVVETLDLSSDEQQSTENILQQYLRELNRLAGSRAYETNAAAAGFKSDGGFVARTIVVPPLAADGKQLKDNLVNDLRTLLGAKEAALVLSPLSSHAQWISLERMGYEMVSAPQLFTLAIDPGDPEHPKLDFFWHGHAGHSGTVTPVIMPEFLRDRFEPWVRGLGLNHDIFTEPSQ
jgi:RNA polymerase sigma factor (sigma-70 family)